MCGSGEWNSWVISLAGELTSREEQRDSIDIIGQGNTLYNKVYLLYNQTPTGLFYSMV